jgi:plastocyanin
MSNIEIVHAQSFVGTTFPPPVFYTIRDQPSYEISIPFTSTGEAAFVPNAVSIPVGMTVIWFNNDNGEHSVTTLTNNSYSPPEAIDSGPIVQNGGSFIHTFNHPATYVYFDQFDPSARGSISVGSDRNRQEL